MPALAGVSSTIIHRWGSAMTLCPIAIAVGCAKCPAVSVCPLKTVIGDAPKSPPPGPGKKP